MRQLIGRKVVKDKELQYSVFGDDTEGYAVEICEISRFSREAAFFPVILQAGAKHRNLPRCFLKKVFFLCI